MANIPSLIDMSDIEIADYLRGPSTSTPATVRSRTAKIADENRLSSPSILVNQDGAVQDGAADRVAQQVVANEHHPTNTEENLHDLQRRHKELEVMLAEERGRRKVCQEMLEKSSILQQGPAPGPDPPGPAERPGRLDQLSRSQAYVNEATQAIQAPPRRVAATLKLGTYNGTTPLDMFLAKVNNCQEYYEWSEKDTVHHLRASLEGSAAQVLIDCAGVNVSLNAIINLLRTRFGDQNQTERFRSELSMRRRQKGESLQAVYQDIRRLVALAFPGQAGATPGSVYEIVARDAFLAAMNNPSIRRRILERDPPPDTIDAALTAAVRLEALDSTESDAPTTFARTQSVAVGNEQVSFQRTNDTRLKTLESSMSAIQSQLQALLDQGRTHSGAGANIPGLGPDPPLSTWTTPWTPPPPPVADWQINAASKSEEWRRTSAPGGTSRGRGGGGRLPKDTCKVCHQKGHWGNECPTKGAQQGHVASTREVRSVVKSSDSYVEILLRGRKLNALLDTGSERSLIPRRMVASVPLKPSNVKLYAANGTEIANLGTMVLKYQLEDINLQTELVVSDEIDELIFGFDWLVTHDCRWQFKERVIFVCGKPVGLRMRQSRANMRRIYVREDTVVAPGAEVNVPVSLPYQSRHTPRADWLAEAKTIVPGVYAARTLLPGDDKFAAIRLVNVTSKPYSVWAGRRLGDAAQAECWSEYQAATSSSTTEATGAGLQEDPGPQDVNAASSPQPEPTKAGYGGSGLNKSKQEAIPPHLLSMIEQLKGLSSDERSKAETLIRQYADIFSAGEFDLGCTPLMEHRIDTGNARPLRQGLRRHPQAHLEIIDAQVDKMLEAGIIEESASPWASNIVLVKKAESNAPPRCTVDYRRLNLLTYKDAYPLPNIGACLDALEGCSYFSCLDLRSGFYQVPLHLADADKSAFLTRRGQFRFKVLSMGLCNAPSSFQRLMDLVLRGLTWSSCLVYVDDVIVMSKSFDQHVIHLGEVFQRIKDAKLKLKPEKCRLFASSVKFLGHVVSSSGTAVNPEKTAVISTWPAPTNVAEVRTYLGICGYYRRFVEGYALIAAPLHQLLRKGQPFIWTDACQESFERLKVKLTSAPVLAMAADTGRYVLDVDASNIGAGAVLQQEQQGGLRVVAYASRMFNKAEANYCITTGGRVWIETFPSVSSGSSFCLANRSFCLVLYTNNG